MACLAPRARWVGRWPLYYRARAPARPRAGAEGYRRSPQGDECRRVSGIPLSSRFPQNPMASRDLAPEVGRLFRQRSPGLEINIQNSYTPGPSLGAIRWTRNALGPSHLPPDRPAELKPFGTWNE